MCSSANEIRQLGDALRVGFRVRGDAGDPFLGEAVSLREMPERFVRGDNRPPVAVRQSGCVGATNLLDPARVLRGTTSEGRPTLRQRARELSSHDLDELRITQRVEPHVRVERVRGLGVR